VNSLLIVGVDTVAGANLALFFAEKCRVWTWASQSGYEIANCEALDPADAPAQIITQCRPDHIIYCGPAAASAWEANAASKIHDDIVEHAQEWASAAELLKSRFVMISSDAVFSGPWMFHEEDSPSACPSCHAQLIRAAEQAVLETCSQALVVRTNVFGWSADPRGSGWLETIIAKIETRRFVDEDHIRHATPILATDLAEIVDRACREELHGVYHVAGAERVSPLKFVQRLADRFDLPWLAVRRESVLNEPPRGFGEGECSLQTKQIRKELCVAMPLLSEGLNRLHEQAHNGYRDKLRSTATESRQAERRAA
jgi:dTDP-4-dehydrorhamnose reductase